VNTLSGLLFLRRDDCHYQAFVDITFWKRGEPTLWNRSLFDSPDRSSCVSSRVFDELHLNKALSLLNV